MKSVLFIIFIIHVVQNKNIMFKEKTIPEDTIEFFANFLQTFHEFHVIFHADSQTITFVNDIVHILNCRTINNFLISIEIYNHDTLKSENDFIRPNISHIVNVLLSEKSHFWSALNTNQKIINNDIIVFVGWTSELQTKILEEASEALKLAGNTLAIELSKDKDKNNTIYRICYYCGELSNKFVLILTTNTTEITVDLNKLLPNNFLDMNGHLLHTIYVQYYPFVYCQTGKIDEIIFEGKRLLVCTNLKGIESYLMRTMSEKLNFTMLVHTLDANGSFFDMIKYVNAKHADIAFGGISITEDRIPYVQFSNQYNAEDYVFLYVLQLTFTEIFDKFIEPFRAILAWVLYILALFVLSFTVYKFRYMTKRYIKKKNTYGHVLWVFYLIAFVHSPFEQAMPRVGFICTPNPSAMMLLGLWWWSTLIMCTFYKSSMLSTMVNPPNTEPEDMEQLVRAGYTFAGNIHYHDIIDELLNVNDPIYKEAFSKTIFADNACDAFEKTLDGGIAMLDELSEIQFELRTICPDPSGDLADKFRITKKSVRNTGHGWGLQVGAPFRSAVDHYLSLVLSGGLFKKWTRDETIKLKSHFIRRSREGKTTTAQSLSLERLLPLLAIYSTGIGLAIICFIIEIIVNCIMSKKHV